MVLLMGALVVVALGVLAFAAIARKRAFARWTWPLAGLFVALAAVELAYRQGLGDGAKLAFSPPLLRVQESQLLIYGAAMLGAAVVVFALAAVFRQSTETDARPD